MSFIQLQKTGLFLVLILSISGCSFSHRKTPKKSESADIATPVASFEKVRDDVLLSSCLECHSWVQNHRIVKAKSESIFKRVFEDSLRPMPPRDAAEQLTIDQRRMLRTWLDAGSPEEAPSTSTTSTTTSSTTTSTTGDTTTSTTTTLPPSYLAVQQKVFTRTCVGCHEAFSSYAGVSAKIREIESEVFVKKAMPPIDAPLQLTAEQRGILDSWIKQGAPEYGEDNPAPVEPISAKFSSIKKHVIERRCIGCHSPGGTADLIPLTRHEDLMDGLVVPGDAASSFLMTAITEDDRRRMPPRRAGPRLTIEEVDVIRSWINSGAPNN